MRIKLRVTDLQKRYGWILLLAALTLFAAAASATITPARRQRAIAAFESDFGGSNEIADLKNRLTAALTQLTRIAPSLLRPGSLSEAAE